MKKKLDTIILLLMAIFWAQIGASCTGYAQRIILSTSILMALAALIHFKTKE